MNTSKFVPVKITDKQWADRLMSGEIFMRSLHDFGSWNRVDAKKNNDEVLGNNYRGDCLEAAVYVTDDINNCEVFKGMEPEFKKMIKQVALIDSYDSKYMKIFSLYCLEYNALTDYFVFPDERMKDFGDTAVIIRDFDAFLKRIAVALLNEYGNDFLLMLDRVSFFDFPENRNVNPMFEKHKSYSYQKEMRLAFGELEKNVFARNIKYKDPLRLVWSIEPKTICIGDISDIAFELPIDELLQLKGLEMKNYRWQSGVGEEKTFYDYLVEETRKTVKDFHTPEVTAVFTI